MSFIETPDDIDRQLEDVRKKLRDIEEADSWRVHLARLSDARPYHPALLVRTLFALLASFALLFLLLSLGIPFLTTQFIQPIRLFESAIGMSVPVLLGIAMGALVVGWVTATLAAVNEGKESPLMEEEQLIKQKLMDEAARLSREKAVIERIHRTPVPVGGRISPGESGARALLPSVGQGSALHDAVRTPGFLVGATPAPRTRTPMGAKTRAGTPLGAAPKSGKTLGAMPGFDPTPPPAAPVSPETPLDLSYGAPSKGYTAPDAPVSWNRAAAAPSKPAQVGNRQGGYPLGTPADPRRVASAYPLATPVEARRRVGEPAKLGAMGLKSPATPPASPHPPAGPRGIRVGGAALPQGVAVSAEFPPRRGGEPQDFAHIAEIEEGFSKAGAGDTPRPSVWGQVEEPWLEEALEKAEALAAGIPVQAELLYSQEDYLPFTLVLKRVTPAVAVRILSQYVEFLAGISTPPRARVLMRSGGLDPAFHRSVKAALEPYFSGSFEVRTAGDAVDVVFHDPDEGWREHRRLPFRK